MDDFENLANDNLSLNPKQPIGAVAVIGGGIAGMQASLDLAGQGFKVYLIERQTAIGGKMAQLDKTFPTNDCAMCTISPKLIETGRHPNIEIITNAEVIKLDGQAGSFQLTVQHNPRYIDLEKCVGCGECETVCPVITPDRFNEGLSTRHAAFKLYPQAVPNAFAIEKRGIAACRDACPAGQRAQGYIALIREGRYDDAMRVIKMDNPFPGICGRICNHRCEDACNRGLVDEPVNIHSLKRFVTDEVYSQPRQPVEAAEIRYPGHRVAIIGAGPCGLTAAKDLVLAGFPVTVLEAMPVAGGMLRLGVPEYRLPATIIEREVQDIVDLGVELRLNHRVDNLDDVFDEGFSAVLIAVGAHEGIRLPIPGANLDGVLINTHFLRDVRLGKYEGWQEGKGEAPPGLGKNVLVLGGGNVAIDVARSAVRLGCNVSMACLENRETMPSHDWEIAAAVEEGISLYPARSFERIVDDGQGRVAGVECMDVSSFNFDDLGRLNVEKTPNSSHILPCDTVIFSVGQRAGLAFIPDDAGVGLTQKKMIAINPNTFAATRPGVFAAGDSVSGTAFVIEAVASGHKVAEAMIRYLRGEHLEPLPKPELPVVKLTQEEIAERIAIGEIKSQPRVPLPQLPLDERLRGFAEVEGGYDEEAAQKEAARCLACGICSECMSCTFECGMDAINHDMGVRLETIKAGAVILAPGYQVYHSELSDEYGFGRYPNVITALHYERILSASGPTHGHVRRPSDGTAPRRIAFLQCVGSRDQSHDYCSSVCCMYAAKEAMMTIEHARAEARRGEGDGEVEIQVFFMDTRAFSKGYEEYYRRAEQKYGVKYTRARISMLAQDPQTHNLILRYAQPYEGKPQVVEQEFDLVVLSVGMEISEQVRQLGKTVGIELDDYGFCHTTLFDPLQSSRPGIYVAGPFREPKDIPETVVEASGAAASAAMLLAPARHTLTRIPKYPIERDVTDEEPRVGVFVCHCGSNIGGYLDVPSVADYAAKLPGVVHAEDNLYTCSQNTVSHIIEQIQELGLNRVVVASCTPITHEPLFQDALRQAGINPHLFDMANIRNQCSWVHSNDWDGATRKAKDLVRMAVARVTQLEPLETALVQVSHTALVIGGGAAGMTAALTLADQGFPVHLVERNNRLGGNLRHLHILVTDDTNLSKTPQEFADHLEDKVLLHPYIQVHLQTEVVETGGFMGNFTTKLMHQGGHPFEVRHGATIVATGGEEYHGNGEYGLNRYPQVVTQLDFENMLAGWAEKRTPADPPNSVVMIQCVGPAERYCSRICCSTALKNALWLKEINPQAEVTILYRDLRTYGFKERLYTQARQVGVRFIHYEFDRKPEVEYDPHNDGCGVLHLRLFEPVLGREIQLSAGLLVLSMPIVPAEGMQDLASLLKISTGADGFFLEAHVKLRPVDFAADGVFMAGMAHYPKFLDEAISQARAAASRAALILSQENMLTNARVAVVDPQKCVGCLTCVRICPFHVPKIQTNLNGVGEITGAAYIETAVCHGCGSCASECPARAIQLMHYRDVQTMAKLEVLVAR